MATACAKPNTAADSAATTYSPQSVEVSGHIARVMIVQLQIGHSVTGYDALGRAQPRNHVVGRIGQHSGDDRALADIIEGRTDAAVGATYPRDFVARAATETGDQRGAAPRSLRRLSGSLAGSDRIG